jgi:nitric oxide reductase NorF protein
MRNKSTWLFGSAAAVMILAIVAALISAQWKHEAVPMAALSVILLLTILKSRVVILDFMELRGSRPGLPAALVAWPTFFCLAAGAKALLVLLVS